MKIPESVNKRKVFKSFAWVAGYTYTSRLINFSTTLVLAKVLDPKDFGLVAIGMMFLEVFRMFSEMGFGKELIYRKNQINLASDTSFIIIPSVNLLLTLIALFIAPYAAHFLGDNRATNIIIFLSFTLVLNSITIVPLSLLQKELLFNKIATIEIISHTFASLISIILALNDFGVWSLVWRQIIYSIISATFIWRVADYRPKLRFDFKIAKELINYGKHIIGATVFLMVLYNIDKLAISKILGATTLGFYSLAFNIANLPVSELSRVINKVMFPVYSKLKKDKNTLRNYYLKSIQYIAIIAFPMSFGIAIFCPVLFHKFYGLKWMGMFSALRILAFYGLFRSLATNSGEIFKSIGEPKWVQFYTITQLIVILPMIYFMANNFGIEGVSILMTTGYGFRFLIELNKVCSLLNMKISEVFNKFKKPFIFSMLSFSPSWIILNYSQFSEGLPAFFTTFLFSTSVYVYLNIRYDRESYNEVIGLFKKGDSQKIIKETA